MSTSPKGSAQVSQPDESTNNIPAYAVPENELIHSIGLPRSTYRACVVGGKGPRTFKLGRRNYILLTDWKKWLESIAETGGLTCRGAR